ncbi:hypothetical protein H6G51_10980 [Limnothrix sp. FACHB-708]|nr:hypothetical protein [Limnothrix sp. FACHB-406]MBD2553802.1 hypothetical protein [Limnothrix sp. FACHB-708]
MARLGRDLERRWGQKLGTIGRPLGRSPGVEISPGGGFRSSPNPFHNEYS